MRLLYFAWVRVQIGVAEEQQTLPDESITVAALLDWLPSLGPGHARALEQRAKLRVAVNQVFAESDMIIRAGDEVAVFPPVTGG
ncbi:MAG: molybdopterin converting factor subunit 1 [Kiloniella sp.]|nr:molybdopterin converting factor subunit 1 [Kiloniella sp.]